MELQKAKFRSALSPDMDVKVKPLRGGAPVFITVGPRTAVGVVVEDNVSAHAQNHTPEKKKKINNIMAILLTAKRVSFPHTERKGTTLIQ
jgi:hypothetical protein